MHFVSKEKLNPTFNSKILKLSPERRPSFERFLKAALKNSTWRNRAAQVDIEELNNHLPPRSSTPSWQITIKRFQNANIFWLNSCLTFFYSVMHWKLLSTLVSKLEFQRKNIKGNSFRYKNNENILVIKCFKVYVLVDVRQRAVIVQWDLATLQTAFWICEEFICEARIPYWGFSNMQFLTTTKKLLMLVQSIEVSLYGDTAF